MAATRRLAEPRSGAAPETLAFLAERCEGNLIAARQEIEKLGLLLPEGDLDPEAVERAVTDVARYDVFQLSEAWLAPDAPRALRIIDALQADGHLMVGFHSTATGAVLPLEFQQDGRVRTLVLPSRVRVRGADSYLGAALAGFGIVQSPRYRLDAYFADGRLVPLLEAFPPTPTPVNIVYARTRLPSPRLRAFIDWASGVFPPATP